MPRGAPSFPRLPFPRPKPKGPRNGDKPNNRKPTGAGNERPTGASPDDPKPSIPADDVANLLGIAPGIVVSGSAGLWQRFEDPTSGIEEKTKDLGKVFDAIGGGTEKFMQRLMDGMYSDPDQADMLL